MKVGIIGSGGREHAICHSLSKSDKVREIYCFPGNAGTQKIAKNIIIDLENFVELKEFILLNKIDLVDEKFLADLKTKIKSNVIEVSANSDINIEILKEKIYEKLKFIRIYMKPKGEDADFKEPFIAREGDTVEDICNKMHRRLKRQFRYGLVWGKSVKFGGQRVGLTHIMLDEDVITIIKSPGP